MAGVREITWRPDLGTWDASQNSYLYLQFACQAYFRRFLAFCVNLRIKCANERQGCPIIGHRIVWWQIWDKLKKILSAVLAANRTKYQTNLFGSKGVILRPNVGTWDASQDSNLNMQQACQIASKVGDNLARQNEKIPSVVWVTDRIVSTNALSPMGVVSRLNVGTWDKSRCSHLHLQHTCQDYSTIFFAQKM